MILYCKYNVTKMQHKRAAVASMFKNDISRIPNVRLGTIFTETVTIIDDECESSNIASQKVLKSFFW